MNSSNFILALAVIATALISGLYYSYSCSVNPGLAQLPDTGYVQAMQSINVAIQNPLFFASFFGTLILLPLSAYFNYSAPDKTRFHCLIAATAIYAVGSMGVTILGNVPLNNALASFDLKTAQASGIAAARKAFEAPWNRLHAIRTIAAFLALVPAVAACFFPGAKQPVTEH